MIIGLLLIIASALGGHTYGDTTTRNAGVVVTLPNGHWCGVETRPVIGAFCDVD